MSWIACERHGMVWPTQDDLCPGCCYYRPPFTKDDNGSLVRVPAWFELERLKKAILSAVIWSRARGRCRYCDREMTFETGSGEGRPTPSFLSFTIDHVRPKSQGGADDLENLVAACSECNTLKSDGPDPGRGQWRTHLPGRLFTRAPWMTVALDSCPCDLKSGCPGWGPQCSALWRRVEQSGR